MYKRLLPILMVLMVLNFSIAPILAFAQDSTETATVEAETPAPTEETDEPPPVTVVVTAIVPTDVPVDEPTDPPVPDDSVRFPQAVFVVVIVVLGVLFSLFLVSIRAFVIELLRGLSPFLRPVVYTGVEAALGELRRIARETADTADDEQIEKFAREWEQIKREVDGTIQAARSQHR